MRHSVFAVAALLATTGYGLPDGRRGRGST